MNYQTFDRWAYRLIVTCCALFVVQCVVMMVLAGLRGCR